MPKRHDDLFGGIANFAALRLAARRAIKGKRKKPGAAAFMANFEREILRLDSELRDGSYTPGRYVEILVREPKERLVSAAPFRDRVVHHALCAVICPLFETGLIDNTFANRTGKGTHAAVHAYERYRDRHAHVLRCDIFRYFPSIDHAILKREFRRRVACESTLRLMDTIVDHSNAQEPVDLHFAGDDLIEPYRRRRGLPIGNLTSQFLANLYLNSFDHWVTEVRRVYQQPHAASSNLCRSRPPAGERCLQPCRPVRGSPPGAVRQPCCARFAGTGCTGTTAGSRPSPIRGQAPLRAIHHPDDVLEDFERASASPFTLADRRGCPS